MDDMTLRSRRTLIVDDDDESREWIARSLRDRGDHVDEVSTGEAALHCLERDVYDVVLLELRLPRMQGLSVLSAATSLQMDARFIIMTADGSIETAVEAMRLGAFDYLRKPVHLEDLVATLDRACQVAQARRDAARQRHVATDGIRARLIGDAPAMRRLFQLIERIAPLHATVMVTGETGTGKELVARAIHDASPRSRRPFVAINCSALPESLLEAELFGHVKGSFTGAIANRRGLVEEASGGTLFLDEIATLSQRVQVTLLRVLEDRSILRVGSSHPVHVDFRLIVATNEDLAAHVDARSFREDLYYRLNVFPIRVPALRERREDIPILAEHFRMRFARENGVEPPRFSTATLSRMLSWEWPGNVRELEHFVERAMILSIGETEVHCPSLDADRHPTQHLVQEASEHEWNLERLEREYMLTVLERTEGHRGRAADILGIDRRTLYRKLRGSTGVTAHPS